MSEFTETTLTEKLSRLTNHADSIQSLSGWLQKNFKNREIIIRVWLRMIRKETKSSQVVNMLYLANDVAQNTRKSCPHFKEDFFPALENAFRHVSKADKPDIEKALHKLIKVWKDREIYSNSQIKKLTEIMNTKKMAASFPAPAGHDPVKNPRISQYIGEEVTRNAQDFLKSLQRLQNPPSTHSNVRVVLSNFPESISCPEKLQTVRSSEEAKALLAKNDEALPLLVDYVSKLQDEIQEREHFQNILDCFIQNVKLSVENHEKQLKEVKRKEDRLKLDLLEVEKSFDSLPDLTAEMPMAQTSLPTLDNLFGL